MDFDRLPDFIFLNIFRHFEFDHRVDIGRVNKAFHRMSLISVSQTESLNLEQRVFQLLTPAKFSRLLDLCSSNLERIKFRGDHERQRDLVSVFSRFSFPRLSEIDLSNVFLGHGDLNQLLRQNRNNLRSLICNCLNGAPIYFPEIVCTKLEILKGRSSDLTFRSLLGRCPNLKHFETSGYDTISSDTLDAFFSTCPRLETLVFRDRRYQKFFTFDSMVHFWTLNSLNRLILGHDYGRQVIDDDLIKIGKYLLGIQVLQLTGLTDVTNQGVRSLANLKNLQKLTLIFKYAVEIDEGLRWLADCDRLEEIQLNVACTTMPIVALIRFCPRLRFVCVDRIEDIDTIEAALAFLQSIGDYCSQKNNSLTIRIRDSGNAAVFASKQVRKALEKMQKIDGRGAIKFEKGDFVSLCDVNRNLF